MYQVEPIIYRREQKGEVPFIDTLDGNYLSHRLYEAGKKQGTPKLSVGVLGYKHIEDTRNCVFSVLKYIGDIDYELILVDNGSKDNNETLDFYQSVPTLRKKIIQVEEPLGPMYGAIFGTRLMYEYSEGDIFVMLGNDNIITENALQNMIACLDSSPDIGMAVPMSCNAYMLQNPGLRFSTSEEMFAAAKEFNRRSDPRKWQERMEAATVATAIKREALVQSGFYGFWSAESDLCHRIRQAGYKIILLGDTWVCHNHDYTTKKDSQAWLGGGDLSNKIMETSKQLQKDRAGGLDQFGDIMVFEQDLCSMLEQPQATTPDILAINVTCGQPLLDLKNRLRQLGVFQTKSTAFTTDAKYYAFLSTAADQVVCDRIQFLSEDLKDRKFDAILLGEYINRFPEPEALIRTLWGLLKPNGQLLFKLKNNYGVQALLAAMGYITPTEDMVMTALSFEDIKKILAGCGASSLSVTSVIGSYNQNVVDTVSSILLNNKVENAQEKIQSILTAEYLFCAH